LQSPQYHNQDDLSIRSYFSATQDLDVRDVVHTKTKKKDPSVVPIKSTAQRPRSVVQTGGFQHGTGHSVSRPSSASSASSTRNQLRTLDVVEKRGTESKTRTRK
jgi:hypothetical protein